ncbi:MAG: diaminopimelate epimerase [Bacteroidota bacterium]
MKIQFTKMSGAGNDFVVVDNRTGIIGDPKKFSVAVCDRRYGIGADGVLLLESSKKADFEMKYYNADGSNAGMCGNGGRCLSKFAYDIGIINSDLFKFEGFGHIYSAKRIKNDIYQLKMKDPQNVIRNQKIPLKIGSLLANYINTGTDHCVIFIDENPDLNPLTAQKVHDIGWEIRYHDAYMPIGTNVNFVSQIDATKLKIRTYERGVEAETLACGTGSVASAILGTAKYGMGNTISVEVQSGETLEVSFTKKDDIISDVYLKGSAVTTFTGEIDL